MKDDDLSEDEIDCYNEIIDSERPIFKEKTKKLVNDNEYYASILHYLNNKRHIYIQNFKNEIIKKLNKNVYNILERILEKWTDGFSNRKHNDVGALKKAIKNYIYYKYPKINKIYCDENVESYPEPFRELKPQNIDTIISISSEIIENIINELYEKKFINNMDDFVIYRGLNLKNISDIKYKNSKCVYKENNYLSSYSLSWTVAENFAITGFEKKALIISNYNYFYERVFLSSIFFEKFIEKQFELLVIPHWDTIKFKYCTELYGIKHFYLYK